MVLNGPYGTACCQSTETEIDNAAHFVVSCLEGAQERANSSLTIYRKPFGPLRFACGCFTFTGLNVCGILRQGYTAGAQGIPTTL
jgi:hypothetical protein